MRPVVPHAARSRSELKNPSFQNGSSDGTQDTLNLGSATHSASRPNDEALSNRTPTCPYSRLLRPTCHCPITPIERLRNHSWPPDLSDAAVTMLFEFTVRP